MSKRQKFQPTSLLSPEENKEIRNLLGRKCSSLVTTVIQLYHTDPPDHSDWTYKACGVLCLVQDSKKRMHFFRLYCLIRKTMIWEYEIHKNLEYTCPASFFSSFEGDECIFAFNFACRIEASAFNAVVFHRISNPNIVSVPYEEKKEKKEKISKKIISQPIEPRHVFHVGFQNIEVMKLSPAEIESYFDKKNIHKKCLLEKPKVEPSVVARIQTFPKTNDEQNITSKTISKATSFNSFQGHSIRNVASAPNSPLLQRNNGTVPRKVAPNLMPKPLKMSMATNKIHKSQQNLSYSHVIPNQNVQKKRNDFTSIDESLAILNGISDSLKDAPDDLATNTVPNFHESRAHNLSAVTEDFRKTLARRVQAVGSSEEDCSSDDWDD
ncbi:WASp [Trypoxylus dichotomus]